MTDLGSTILAKSDQLNADDLIGRTLTIRVSRVSKTDGEQPISINYEGDGGKPYKPGKSMRRVLVQLWGRDGNAYVGRAMTLYRDPAVKFGGLEVGGIRISHMSHLDAPVALALTASKGNKKAFKVQPLREEPRGAGRGEAGAAKSSPAEDRPPADKRPPAGDPNTRAAKWADAREFEVFEAKDPAVLGTDWNKHMKDDEWRELREEDTQRAADLKASVIAKIAELKGEATE